MVKRSPHLADDARPGGSVGAPSRVARKRGERVERILATTAQVLAERGFGETGLEEIAERLDVTKASLYHYFGSKEQLVSACIDRLAEHATGELVDALGTQHSATSADRLRLLVHRHLFYMLRERPESRLFAAELDWPETYLEQLKTVRRRHDRLFRDVIAAGIDAGEFRVISLDASLHCLWGALNHIPVWYRDPTDASLETIIDEISDTVLMLFGVE